MEKLIHIISIISTVSIIISGITFVVALKKMSTGNTEERHKRQTIVTKTGLLLGVATFLAILFIPLSILLLVLGIFKINSRVKMFFMAGYLVSSSVVIIVNLLKNKKKKSITKTT